tara:strand:+ start:573 stop:731 length:159 start_codon:yes stop_codon:yes gene_type:complete
MKKLKIIILTFIGFCIGAFISNKFLGIEFANTASLFILTGGMIWGVIISDKK